MAEQAVTFLEIEKMLSHFPAQPNAGCGGCERQSFPVIDHVKSWQVNEENRLKLTRPRVCLFAAAHGLVDDSTALTKAWLEGAAKGMAVINQLCQLADAELRIYELDIDNPCGNISAEPAMDEMDAARAITYGMMAVEPGLDVIILGAIGAGSSLSAQAMLSALGEDNNNTDEAVQSILTHHGIQSIQKPLEVLRRLGGYDFCAMLGAAIAARMAGIPVFVDSLEGQAIKKILDEMAPHAGDHIYMINEKDFAAETHRAVAIIPSLKAHLILNQDITCQEQGSCAARKAS